MISKSLAATIPLRLHELEWRSRPAVARLGQLDMGATSDQSPPPPPDPSIPPHPVPGQRIGAVVSPVGHNPFTIAGYPDRNPATDRRGTEHEMRSSIDSHRQPT